MTTVTPDYLKDFKCIADKCKHNCCIGWEIDIDDVTLKKYHNLKCDFSSKLISNIEFNNSPHFKLDSNERCPFLNQKGLCDIIINIGKDMLCQICRDHPRFRNYYENFEEIGIGLCCEAAAKIIISKQDKATLNLSDEQKQIPLIKFREKIFGILQDRTIPFSARIDNMLDTVGAQLPSDTDWYQIFYNLERLDNAWDKYLLRIKNGIDTLPPDSSLDTAYEQLVVYLIFRHFTDCQYDNLLKERILFSALIYKIINTMNHSNTLDELLEIARLYSSEIEYSDQSINKILYLLS